MKRTVSLILILLMVMGLALPAQAADVAYPQITLNEAESSRTIPQGGTGELKLTISPRYVNEKYIVQIYDSEGRMKANASGTLKNTSTAKRNVTVSIDTAELAMGAGTYSVVYYMEYYYQAEWHEVPDHYSATFKVIAGTCEDTHNYALSSVIKEATCTAEGQGWYKCKDCGHEETQSIEKEDHVYTQSVLTAPKQDADGEYECVCDGCGDSYTEVIPSSAAVKITAQPESTVVSAGEMASFTVKATGEGLVYRWYYQDVGSDSWKVALATKATYTLESTVERNGRSFHCVVTDKFGNKEQSETVTLTLPPVSITKQPKDAKAFEGEKAKISLKATGDGLKYQWYYKSPEDEDWKKASGTSKSYSLTMTEARNGRLMMCIVTDMYGKTAQSDVVTLSLSQAAKIVKQPKSASALEGEMAVTTIEATGDGLTYQWYYKNPGSSKFKKSSITTAECAVTMTEARDGREMYCIVTDEYGNEVKSKTVTLKIKRTVAITKQPKDAWANEGEKAKISVKATGDGLTYQWYYLSATTGEWTKASGTEKSYSLTMTEARDGRQMKCVVTDEYGNSEETSVVTLTTCYPVTITKQPKSAKAFEGEKAVATIEAEGEGLTYQWYYKNPGSSTYKKSSITTAECAVTMTEARDGRKMYCIVTDQYGNGAKSKTITLKIAKTVEITKQPKSVTIDEGETAKFTVKATGDSLKYQWYYQNPGEEEWKKCSGTKATYSLKATEARDGRRLYCEITDAYGNVETTKTVKLKVD